jgi:DNA-binding transcriptional LysR family regulator
MPTNYLETLKMMTSVGLGWSVLPVRMLDSSLRVLPVEPTLARLMGAIGLSGRDLSGAAQALLAIVEQQEPKAKRGRI